MTVMPNGVNLTPDNNGVSRTDAASAENGPQLEALYTQWKRDPASVDAQWNAFFAGFELGCQQPPRPARRRRSGRAGAAPAVEPAADRGSASRASMPWSAPIAGSAISRPSSTRSISSSARTPELSLDYMKLTEADLDSEFEIYWAGKLSRMPLRTIIDLLHETYCGHVGIEYMHIENYTIRRWLRDRIEEGRLRKDTLPNAEKKRVLTHLLEGELFEKFLHTRYVGQKRFSLEGGETIIPILDKIVEECPRHGVEQIVMGMAHRGRLNVLANILGKDYEFVFNEFAENYVPNSELGDGDVKYHLGYDSIVTTSTGTQDRHQPRAEPEPSRGGLPGGRGQGARVAAPAQRHGGAAQGAARAHSRRRLVCRAGRGGGDAESLAARGLPHRRHDPHHHQQPDRLHHLAGRRRLQPVLHLGGEDARLADFPRQRRRPDRGGHDHPARLRVPAAIPARCRGRHVLLPPPRPQRGRRAALHPAADVLGHRGSSADQRHLLRPPGQVRRHHARRSARLPRQVRGEAQQRAAKIEGRDQDHRPGHPQIAGLSRTARSRSRRRCRWRNCAKSATAITREPEKIELNPEDQALAPKPPRDDRGQGAARLEHGRGARLRQPARKRLPGASLRPGQPPRHVHPAPLGALRREDARALQAAQQHQAGPGQVLRLQQPALGVRRARFRLRLRARFPRHARALGSAVRRFRQRRADHHRPVHRLLGNEMGRDLQHRPAPAPRLSRPGAGALQRAARALSAGLRGGQHPGRQSLDAGQLFPHPAPPGAAQDQEAAHSHDAEGPVARSALHLAHRRFRHRAGSRKSCPIPPRRKTPSGSFFAPARSISTWPIIARRRRSTDTAIIRIEQLYPLHEKKLQALVAPYAKAEKIVWCQEESANMGAWPFIEPRLRKVFGRDILYAGRDASASTATGSHAIHELEQRELVKQAFSL